MSCPLGVVRIHLADVDKTVACLVLDPQSKRHRPRNYLEMLEGRVASLEGGNRHPRSPSHSTPSPSLLSGVGVDNNDNNDNNSTQSNSYTPENGDSTSDLSSRVGMLDFQTVQMEPQYLGSSSAFAFSRIINFSLRRDLPVQPSLASLNDRLGVSLSSPSPCLLPEREVALALSNAYFLHIHPQYPFLHEPTFRGWEATLYDPSQDSPEMGFQSSSSSSLFFLNMVSFCFSVFSLSRIVTDDGWAQMQVYAVAALLQSNTQSLAEVGASAISSC